jgi:hypothetical protein
MRYKRNGRDVGAAEALDDDGILRDGFSVTVPLTMRDSMTPLQGSIAQSTARLHDGHGNRDMVGHRPGFIMDAHDARDAVKEAYRLRDEADANAWRAGGAEGREGAVCTVRNGEYPEYFGSPGRIVDGVCTPIELIDEGELRDMLPLRDGLTLDQLQLAHKERTGRAYQAYDEELRNAWRTP